MARTKTLLGLKDYAKRINSDSEFKKSSDQNLRSIQNAMKLLALVSDWTFLRSRTRIVTRAQYITGAVTVSLEKTRVTAVSTASNVTAVFPSSIESTASTFTMKFNGELIDYDISLRSSSNSLTLTSPYIGTTHLVAKSFIIFRRSYNLPTNFREMIAVVDVRNPSTPLIRVSHREMLEMSLRRSDGAIPIYYSIENKTGDAVRQLWLHPFPDGATRFQYDMIFQRYPTVPLLDADVIDWPDDLIPLLESAIAIEIALENEDGERYDLFSADYAGKLRDALRGDVDESASYTVGDHSSITTRRDRFPFHLNVIGDST